MAVGKTMVLYFFSEDSVRKGIIHSAVVKNENDFKFKGKKAYHNGYVEKIPLGRLIPISKHSHCSKCDFFIEGFGIATFSYKDLELHTIDNEPFEFPTDIGEIMFISHREEETFKAFDEAYRKIFDTPEPKFVSHTEGRIPAKTPADGKALKKVLESLPSLDL